MSIQKSPCFDYAIGYLARYPKTTKELRKKLIEKWFSVEEIDITIIKLEKTGFLNDALWAKLYLQSLWRKGKPKNVIEMKLRQKWISKEIFTEVWENVGQDVDASILEKIIKDVEKMKIKWLNDLAIKQKLYARGYSKDTINTAMINLEM